MRVNISLYGVCYSYSDVIGSQAEVSATCFPSPSKLHKLRFVYKIEEANVMIHIRSLRVCDGAGASVAADTKRRGHGPADNGPDIGSHRVPVLFVYC